MRASTPPYRHRVLTRLAYTGVAVGASVAITAVFSWVLNGAVLGSFLLTGFGCSLIVAWFVTGQAMRAQQAELLAAANELRLQANQERLDAVQAVLREVNHHVNNLANNLQLIDLEYARTARLSPQTLEQLKVAVQNTATAIQALNETTRGTPPDATPPTPRS